MTRDEARELISKHSYKCENGNYVISKKVAFIIVNCLENKSLQNRKCENCKHIDDKYFDLFCMNPDVINQHNHLFENGQSMYDNFKVSANFCCNKWESKQ